VDEQPPSLPPPPVPPGHPDYGKSAIQLATEQSEIVVLVRVLAVSSTLSADETAILDTVSTQVETVLKSTPPGSLHVGDHLDLSSNGIKVSIGRQTIKLIESQQAPPLQAGGHYLVFVDNPKGATSRFAGRENWLALEGNTLIPAGSARWRFGGKALDRDAVMHEISTFSLAKGLD
jgi:hypothetical protein